MEDVPAQRICVPSPLAIDPGLACGSGEQQSLEHFGVGGGGGAVGDGHVSVVIDDSEALATLHEVPSPVLAPIQDGEVQIRVVPRTSGHVVHCLIWGISRSPDLTNMGECSR